MIKFVTGFAGSGKSTELSKRYTNRTLVLTPTHKACEVLTKKGLQATTIHSVLKLVPTINENFKKGNRIQVLKQMGDVELDHITDIFIDEFSMINKGVLQILLDLIPEHCDVTIFGDPYQLPPVDGKPIKPAKFSSDIHELTTQHRSENPFLTDTFMKFVNKIKTGKGKTPVNFMKADLSRFNPETDIAIAYTNKRVGEINKELSKYNETKFYTINGVKITRGGKGKYLIYPKTMNKGKLNKDEISNKKITDDIERWNTDLSDYKIIAIGDVACHIDPDHYNNSRAYVKTVEKYQDLVRKANNLPDDQDLVDFCRNNRNAKYVKERGQAWQNYFKHKDLVFDIRLPWCTTVHKSQGQEFDNVYIDFEDLKKSDEYDRMAYVSISRAKKECYAIR